MFAYGSDVSDSDLIEPEELDWQDAACRDGSGALTAVFFSDELADIEFAKGLCARCDLMVPCLEGALARREPAGVWGGQLFVEGRVVAFKRKRGRPRKNTSVAPAPVAPAPVAPAPVAPAPVAPAPVVRQVERKSA
jgi:WhiB family redox-sensing transcriptional regulator